MNKEETLSADFRAVLTDQTSDEEKHLADLLASVASVELGDLPTDPSNITAFDDSTHAPPSRVAEFFARTFHRLGRWLLAFIGVVLFVGFREGKFTFYQWLYVIAAGAALMPVVFLSEWAGKWQKARVLNRRNRFASQIVSAVWGGVPLPAYGLYLRAFSFDGALPLPNPAHGASPAQLSYYLEAGTHDTETLCVEAMAPVLPLIGLGHPSELSGAGKVQVTDSAWRATITALMDHAVLILILPSSTPGTVWETLHLKNRGLMNKALFVVPRKLAESSSWEGINKIYGQIGIKFPMPLENAEVTLLEVDGSGSVRIVCQLRRASGIVLRKVLTAVALDRQRTSASAAG